MWKWYKNGIKYLQSYDVDSLFLGAFAFGILIGILYPVVNSINPTIYFAIGVGFSFAPVYKFIKRDKLSFQPEIIIKTVVEKAPAKKSPAKKKASVKKAPVKKVVTKKPAAKKTTAKKAQAKKAATKKPIAKKSPAKKSTKKTTAKKK